LPFILILLHEFAHFVRRYGKQGCSSSGAKIIPQVIKGIDEKREGSCMEGGEIKICSLFGMRLLKEVNLLQVLYVLNKKSWKQSAHKFRKGFINGKIDITEADWFKTFEWVDKGYTNLHDNKLSFRQIDLCEEPKILIYGYCKKII
jgi:hypothetical protein